MSDPVYRRVIVKLSGEALSAANGFGIDQSTVERLAADLAAAPNSASSSASWSAAATSFVALRFPSAACRGPWRHHGHAGNGDELPGA